MYCSTGRSTTGSNSLGTALVAGRNRVARPAAGITALTARRPVACAFVVIGVSALRSDRARTFRETIGRAPAAAAAGHRTGSLRDQTFLQVRTGKRPTGSHRPGPPADTCP